MAPRLSPHTRTSVVTKPRHSSFYSYQTKTWLLRLIMELQLLHITNILPPLHPIILHTFILLGYPTYRDKTRTYFVQSPLRGTLLSFPGVECPHRVLPPLKCTESYIDHISHILENGQNLFHRVTTHKIQISTNDANFIDSQILTISCTSITCLNSTPH